MTPTINPRSRWVWRLVAAAVPVLVVAGVAGAAVVSRDDPGGDDTLVAATSGQGESIRPLAEAVPIPTPTPPPTPSTIVAPVRVAPVPVPTTAPAPPPTTIQAPAPTVPPTVAPQPVPSATSVTATIVNQYPAAVRLMINGGNYELAPGQEMAGVSIVASPNGNDIVELFRADRPGCGLGDADGYFTGGGSFRVTVYAGVGTCPPDGIQGPSIRVTRA